MDEKSEQELRAERLTDEAVERVQASLEEPFRAEACFTGAVHILRDDEFLLYYEIFAKRLTTHVRVEFDGVEAASADELRALGQRVEDAAFAPWRAVGFRKKRPGSLSARWDSGEPGPRATYVIDIVRALPQPEELAAVLEELAELPRIVSASSFETE